jgi:hemin uptake protein HemP
MSTEQRKTVPAPAALPPTLGRPQPLLDSRELLRGARLVEISHNGEIYRLQATRLGKLILTK